ncbi:unnamed protein product [Lactuca saligna]|uniref:SWIM-type domain-containing protein n=1 Tax=Lactuca saligna TaxID=75948 RepID=A0AA36ELQ5_LACSI|nr:unnamed protein product [Lactuca saligna]
MVENDNEAVYMRVHLHYNGVFVPHPYGYVGGNYFLFTDVDWLGICPIVDDLDFAQFIDTKNEYGEISIYVGHNGNGLEEWWDDDMNLVVNEDNESGLEDDCIPRNEGNTTPDETHPNVGLEDEVIDIVKIPLNKTNGDEFLRRACVAVENGLSESLIVVIVDARRKPIITMLEELRLYIMERMFNLKHKKWTKDVSPIIRKLLNGLKIESRYWKVLPSGLNKFETRNEDQAYDVDLDNRTCSCKFWQLNGYGCAHLVATILFLNKDVDTYMDPIFSSSNYNKTYLNNILPMNGSNMWSETSFTLPLPPQRRRMLGRPAKEKKEERCDRENG